MSQVPNQFAQSNVVGAVDLKSPGSSLAVQVDASQGTALVPGQFVKMMDSVGGIPKVIATAANSDSAIGVVPYEARRATLKANENVEIVFARGGVVWLTASAAIGRGAQVAAVAATPGSVKAAVTTEMIVGIALDKAVNVGDLIRVLLDLPGTIHA